ncbi:helix-turn-helix domain-containing protein [Streptomyces sp. NBC_00868]|uniref:helix-turn-helix domain-containing protein n=1 Tax=unclassified Streptomyces TaxID=2593676 RepID=UPI0032530D8C|nr:helix-turn-helix domain-containing protein [Streptomyces sp. NBC_00868]
MVTSESEFGKCRRCGSHIPHVPGRVGRKPEYCGTECRGRAQRERDGLVDLTRPRAGLPLGRYIAEDLQLMATGLLNAEYEDREELTALLQRARELAREIDYYVAAAVRDAKAAGQNWAAVAKAAQVSIPTARSRWGELEVQRQMERRAREHAAATHLGKAPPKGASFEEGPAGRQGEAGPLRDGPGRAQSLLADALAHLHSRSGMAIRDIAQQTGWSPSYLSRVLSGERSPGWDVVAALAAVFDHAVGDLGVLWDLSQGRIPASRPSFDMAKARLHAALRGLYLAAGSPPIERISELSSVDGQDIVDVLQERLVPTWEMTGAFVKAVGALPADVRPLWEAVHYGFLNQWDPSVGERPDGPVLPGPSGGQG